MTNIKRKVRVICIMILLVLGLWSCKTTKSKTTSEKNDIFIPEPVNQFAFDKETEIETIEPTKAHREYTSDFKLNPDLEIVIGERQFLTKINYIYNNVALFENSNIIVEGMYGWYESWDKTFTFPMVYRNGPAEYGDDQYGGFYLVNINQEAYHIDDWIRVKGKPFMYEHTDSEGEVQRFLFLIVETAEVLSLRDRKAEMVNN